MTIVAVKEQLLDLILPRLSAFGLRAGAVRSTVGAACTAGE